MLKTPAEQQAPEQPIERKNLAAIKALEGVVQGAKAIGKSALGLVSHGSAAARVMTVIPDMMTLGALSEAMPGYKKFEIGQGEKSVQASEQGNEQLKSALHSLKLSGVKFRQAYRHATGQK